MNLGVPVLKKKVYSVLHILSSGVGEWCVRWEFEVLPLVHLFLDLYRNKVAEGVPGP